MPYKHGVTGSSPVVPTKYGPVVQLVRTLACHARGQEFESPSGRQFASVAQSVEQRTENPRVIGSIPIGGTNPRLPTGYGICGFSSFGRARPCQGRGGGFEPRNPLQQRKTTAIRRWFFVVATGASKPPSRRRGGRCRKAPLVSGNAS